MHGSGILGVNKFFESTSQGAECKEETVSKRLKIDPVRDRAEEDVFDDNDDFLKLIGES